jgi:AcrR family transcriptional regulator
VSVGTLYQYFPNKESLLFGILEEHLEKVPCSVEFSCAKSPIRVYVLREDD